MHGRRHHFRSITSRQSVANFHTNSTDGCVRSRIAVRQLCDSPELSTGIINRNLSTHSRAGTFSRGVRRSGFDIFIFLSVWVTHMINIIWVIA